MKTAKTLAAIGMMLLVTSRTRAMPAVAATEVPPAFPASRALQVLLADAWDEELRENPPYATALGDKRYNDRWPDLSAGGRERAWHRSADFARRLQAIDPGSLSAQERLSRSLLSRSLQEHQDSLRFKEWEMPVNQVHGLHYEIPQLVAVTPFDDARDYENYLRRLQRLPRLFTQLTGNLRQGIRDGHTQPAVVGRQVLAQVEALLAIESDESPFAAPVHRFPDGIAPDARDRIAKAIARALAQQVVPAYQAFARFLRTEYIPHGRPEPGIWSIPGGAAYYAFCIRRNTTLDLSAETIHALGVEHVRRDEAAMQAIARQLGFADLKALGAAIASNPALHATSRDGVLDAYRSALEQMAPRLPELFGVLPKARLIVEATPAYTERQRPSATYEPGSADGKRPGRVVVNTFDYPHIPLTDAESTAYHEGIPGHHLQFSLAQELQGMPEFRRHREYTAYTEGWALYAELLGKEAGFYRDPYSEFGRLQGDIWRAIRLVVDTGLHAQHWTRQQVVDYFHDHSSVDETNVQRETDRYIAWPGQALGYKIGQLKLLELRQHAQAALGSRFDLKKFHDRVLDAGALPLDVLDAQIDAWIAMQ